MVDRIQPQNIHILLLQAMYILAVMLWVWLITELIQNFIFHAVIVFMIYFLNQLE